MHGLARSIHWPAVIRLASGSIPASILTLLVLSQLDLNSGAARSLVNIVLAFALILTATSLIFRKAILDPSARAWSGSTTAPSRARPWWSGVALGVLVSISSVGAGAVGVTALLLLYPRLPMARIVGSDIAHAVPLTLVAGIGHWAMGAIDWQLMGVLLTGSLPGIVIGSYFATRVPETALRLLLAATLILVATKLGTDEWQPRFAGRRGLDADAGRALEIPQAREQRKAEQRQRAEDESEHEHPKAAAARLGRHGCRRGRRRRRHQRMLALDHAAGDVIGDGLDDCVHLVGFRDHDAAETRILHETIDPLVAAHQHMRHHVDPQPRRIALADAAVEQVDLRGDLRKQRIERLAENFQPGHFGVAQIDHDAGAVGRLDPRLAQRIAQPDRRRLAQRLPVSCASDIRKRPSAFAGLRMPLTYQ